MVGQKMLSFSVAYQFSSLPTWLFLGTHVSATDVFMAWRRYLGNCTLALWPEPLPWSFHAD